MAKRAGISIVYQNQGKGQFAQHAKGERDELLAVVEFATRFYHEQVLWESADGAQCLRLPRQPRALGEAVCRRFRLGWAPGSGRLVDEARRQGPARGSSCSPPTSRSSAPAAPPTASGNG